MRINIEIKNSTLQKLGTGLFSLASGLYLIVGAQVVDTNQRVVMIILGASNCCSGILNLISVAFRE